MWASTSFSLEEIGIQGNYRIPQIPSIELTSLSRYSDKCIVTNKRVLRSSFQLLSQLDQGSYGNVYLAKRGDEFVIVKQPRLAEMNLLQEAVLQHLAHKTMEVYGIGWAVPKVYDVFFKGEEIWFSMERIDGVSILDWFQQTNTPDLDTFYLLAQICLVLATLELHLNLDHRDLKINNLLLKKQPCKMSIPIGEKVWILESPFQLVVLDFGFACLGSELIRGKPWVNLGDGVLPPMDPCPKEGRDMFHLLISLLGLSIFRQKISSRLHEMIDGWLTDGKKAYGAMARRWSTEHWSYLVSSQPHFSIPNCCPLRILQQLQNELRGHLHST